MISRSEILKGREKEYPLTPELEANLAILLVRVNGLRAEWGKPMIITSGYRPGHYNRNTVGAALKSRHLSCEAIDIHDPTRQLGMWLLAHKELLEKFDLYLEHPYDTSNDKTAWVHLQTAKPPSGERVFRAKPKLMQS